jgi:hypothetical protein
MKISFWTSELFNFWVHIPFVLYKKKILLRTPIPNFTRFGGEGQVHVSSEADFLDEIQTKVLMFFFSLLFTVTSTALT